MGRKPSANPAAILSVSLPLSTRGKLDAFNPRNRSAFINQAILGHIKRNDPSSVLSEATDDPFEAVRELTTAQVASVLLSRLVDEDKKQLKNNLLKVIQDPQFRG
jgi:hypothetical protein